MTIQRKLIDDAFSLVILFLGTEAFQSLIVDPGDPSARNGGSTLLRILWFVVYGVVALRLISQHRQVMMLVRANWCLALLVLLTILSTIWSRDPGFTLRHSIALLGTTLVGIDLAIRYSIRGQLHLLYIVCGFVVLSGIVVQLLFPGLIPTADFDSTAWHGISGAKNGWAQLVVLGAIAVFSRSRRSLRDFSIIACLTLVAFALVGLARSAGALVILIALLILFKLFGALRWRPGILVRVCLASALIVLPLSYLAFQNFDKVTGLLGRDSTLTGRAQIWPLALSDIAKNPIHGYGYSAFWEPDSQPATRIREEIKWDAPGAHNGYIDLALGLGLPGLLLFVASLFISARRAVDYCRRSVEREAMWPLAYLSFFFLYECIESTIVVGNLIYWILYVAVCCSVTKATAADQLALEIDGEFFAPVQMIPLGHERS
jgi:exopolysaccharide production protein ExoQ